MKRFFFWFLFFLPLCGRADWPMYMGNHYLTGNNDEAVPSRAFLNWHFTAPSGLYYPVPHEEMVLVGGLDRNLYALHKVTGEVLWKCNLNYPLIRSCVASGDYILVTAGDYIFTVSKKDGVILWSRKEGVSVQLSTPIVVDRRVYYGSRKFFYARHIHNGGLIWENREVNVYGGTPVYWNRRIYFISKDFAKKSSRLLCLSSTNGALLWSASFPSDPNVFTPVVFDGRVYTGSLYTLYCLDAASGSPVWEKRFDSIVTSHTVFANGRLFLSLMDGKIRVLDPLQGNESASFSSFNPRGSQFILVGETLFIPDSKGRVHAYHYPTASEKWKFQTRFTNMTGTLSAEDGRLYYAVGNLLYSISPGTLPPAASTIAGGTSGGVPQDLAPDSRLNGPPPEAVSPPDEKKEKAEKEKVTVRLQNEKKEPVDGRVTVSQNNSLSRYRTENGRAEVEVEKGKEFDVTAEARDYFVKTETIPAQEKRKSIDIGLEPLLSQRSYSFNNIQFAYDSAELDPSSLVTLGAIADMLLKAPGLQVEIRGHTDSTGGKEYNMRLSQRRAEKVREFLVKKGVLDERLKAKGYGLENPVSPNDTEEGRARNRRTEFYILKK